jgi:DNA-binding winged helix-turn-helix (wHTH) protein/tetratricopeptide (TPR) repeat protein
MFRYIRGDPMEAITKLSGNLRFGVFELDLEAGELHKHGIRVKLQEQQFQILALLAQHPGKLITREELRHVLWSADTFVDFDRNLNKAINKLRAALCDSAENPRFIETLHRRGYRFIAPIQVCNESSAQPETEKDGSLTSHSYPPEAGDSGDKQHHATRKFAFPRTIPYGLGAAAALVICGLLVLYLHRGSAVAMGNSVSAIKVRRSLAVLGFKNLSAHPDDAWISTALADWLTTDLSAGGQLRVISPENVARMQVELSPLNVDRLDRQTLSRIGKNLVTNLVVVGSYATVEASSGRQVRLDLRLQDTSTGETIEAISAIGTEANLFDLISRAGEQLRAKLDIEAVSSREAAEVAVALPSNHEAARLYSEGLERLRLFNASMARDLLQRSIAVEPDYALAHSALASAWGTLGYDELSRAEAKKAFELSSHLPRADRLLVEARYNEMSGEWSKAIDIYRALFEFFPDSLDYGLALANAQFNGGRGQDALETINQLQSLPLPLRDDPRIDLMEARSAETLGEFKRDLAASVRAADKARTIGASLLQAEALADQAWALTNLGRLAEASQAADQARRIFSTAGDKRGLAFAVDLAGIVLQNEGNAVGAKARYEEALAIYRQIGSRLGVADELDDLGDTSLALGDLPGARAYYNEAMNTYREIGHENGICLAKGALAPVLMGLGDNRGAIETAQEAVSICRRLGDQSKTAIGLFNLAKALRMQGRTEEAKTTASEAANIFQEIGDMQSSVRSNLTIAQALMDEGRAREAEFIARDAVAEFQKQKAARDAALAGAVLARAATLAKDFNRAEKAIESASSELANFHDREVELFVQISAARVRAASGGSLNDYQAARSLEDIAREANHSGFVVYEFEPRLALAEMQIRAGNLAGGRSQLRLIEKEASDHGFGLIALQAAGDLKGASPLEQ